VGADGAVPRHLRHACSAPPRLRRGGWRACPARMRGGCRKWVTDTAGRLGALTAIRVLCYIGFMVRKEFYVSIFQISESGYTEWAIEDTDVPGLCLADESLEKLIEICKTVIPELLLENTDFRGSAKVHFKVNEYLSVSDLVA
jgi:hypothetical protein